MTRTDADSFSVGEIISAMEDESSEIRITVPSFQRGIVWGLSQRKELVESILSGWPIGSILLRKRGITEINGNTVVEYSLIDGLQRCTSLKRYNKEPTQHLETDWLTGKPWYSSLKSAILEQGVAGFDEIIISWIRTLDNLESASTAAFQTMLRNTGVLEDGEILNLNDPIEDFISGLSSDFSILEYKVPVVIFDGPVDHLSEIFTRINRSGKPLTKLQIIAAAWDNRDVQINEDNQIERQIATKAKRRLQLFEEDGYEVEEFDENDIDSYCGDLFQYCFGLGKVLLEAGGNIFPSSNDTDPDTIAFYMLSMAKKSRVGQKDLAELPDKIGGTTYIAPDLSGFSAAAKDSVDIVSRWFRWLTDLNLNRVGDEPFIPHSENQMISIVSRVLISKYNPETWEERTTWGTDEANIKRGIRSWYLLDMLSNEWGGSGDSLLFNRCWTLEEDDSGNSFHVISPYYGYIAARESCNSILDSWYQNQMSWKQKSRPALHSKHKLVLKYIYSNLLTVADNADLRFHVEHINSVSHMSQSIRIEDSEGWPMNSISNLMLLESSINQSKGNATVKQFLSTNEVSVEIRDQVLNSLLSDVEEIPNIEDLEEQTYRDFCNQRWRIVKPKILSAMGHNQAPIGRNLENTPPVALVEGPSETNGVSSQEIESTPLEMTYVSIKDETNTSPNTSGKGTPKTSSEVTLQCAETIASEKNFNLSRESRAKFVSTCGEHAMCVLVSKDHKGVGKYWYGIFDHQLEWFETLDSTNKWFVLACGGSQLMFVIPKEKIEEWKESLSSRYLEDRDSTYWHANIRKIDGEWKFITLREFENITLDEYMIRG